MPAGNALARSRVYLGDGRPRPCKPSAARQLPAPRLMLYFATMLNVDEPMRRRCHLRVGNFAGRLEAVSRQLSNRVAAGTARLFQRCRRDPNFRRGGTIHRHLPALVRLQLPVLIVPAGSGNDFARALNLRSMRASYACGVISNRGRFRRRQWISESSSRPLRPSAPTISAVSPAAVWTLPSRGAPIGCRAGCADTVAMPWRYCRGCSSFRLIPCG